MPFVPSSFLLLVVRPGALFVASLLLVDLPGRSESFLATWTDQARPKANANQVDGPNVFGGECSGGLLEHIPHLLFQCYCIEAAGFDALQTCAVAGRRTTRCLTQPSTRKHPHSLDPTLIQPNSLYIIPTANNNNIRINCPAVLLSSVINTKHCCFIQIPWGSLLGPIHPWPGRPGSSVKDCMKLVGLQASVSSARDAL